ncbi:hypothetical protein V8C40DRAFT_263823 [Trichoderma camerunense]
MSLEKIRFLLKEHQVNVEYVKPLPKYTAEKPYILGLDIALSDESIRTNLEFEQKQLNVSDARSVRDELSVEAQGFELLTIPSEIMALHFNDIDSRNETKGVQSLLSQRFKTDKVYLYDHAYRKEESKAKEAEYSFSNRPGHAIIVRNPHADQTLASGRNRVTAHLTPEEQKHYLSDNWRIRIIKVQSAPLLLCDPFSIPPGGIIACDVVSGTYVGESLFLFYSEGHRWFWFKDQDVDEALLFLASTHQVTSSTMQG